MKLSSFLYREEISQTQLAKAAGLDHSTISRLASGAVRPDWTAMERLAVVTKGAVMPNDFLVGDLSPRGKVKAWGHSVSPLSRPQVGEAGPQQAEAEVNLQERAIGQAGADDYSPLGDNPVAP